MTGINISPFFAGASTAFYLIFGPIDAHLKHKRGDYDDDDDDDDDDDK